MFLLKYQQKSYVILIIIFNTILVQGTVPPIGFAIICKQEHIVRKLLKSNELDKTISGVSMKSIIELWLHLLCAIIHSTSSMQLSGPIIIAVKVENIRCATWLLSELGGPEKALQKAQDLDMHQLIEHIEMFMEVVRNST